MRESNHAKLDYLLNKLRHRHLQQNSITINYIIIKISENLTVTEAL